MGLRRIALQALFFVPTELLKLPKIIPKDRAAKGKSCVL